MGLGQCGPGTEMESCSSNGTAEEWKDGRLEAWEIFFHATAILWSERPEANFLRLAKALHLYPYKSREAD